jgi:adenosylcobinamide-GDP ribazoletransferase
MLIASEALSRCAILWLGFVTPAAREGMGAWLCESRDSGTRVASVAWAAGAVWLAGWERGLAAVVLLLLLVWFARVYFFRRLGGVVGDCFGAVQQAASILCLYAFAWPR